MDKQAMFAPFALFLSFPPRNPHPVPLALTHHVFYRAPFLSFSDVLLPRRFLYLFSPSSSLARQRSSDPRRSFSSKLVLLDDVYILFFFPQDVAPRSSPRYNVPLRRPSTTTSLSILHSSSYIVLRSSLHRQCRSPFLTLAARVQSGVLIALTLHESD